MRAIGSIPSSFAFSADAITIAQAPSLIEEALAARAGTVAGWEEFYDSAEVAAYRAALVEGKQVCVEFQTRLDATAKRGVFADTPWIPAALSEVVEARLGCDLFPENPENVFRPVPATTVPEPSG